MPSLNWASKTKPQPIPASLNLDSIIYPQGAGYDSRWDGKEPPDQLILGDNLAVMSALLPQFEGQINLIYADPPFFTNKHYPARVGRGEDSRKPGEWQLAEGYPDRWENIDDYLDMLYPRLALMHRLLSPDGTLYLHLDWHANAYARLLLDEIFSPDRLLNEIIWLYHGPSPIRSAFNRKHDTILVYTKSDQYTFNVDDVRQPYDPSTVKTFASSPKAGFGKVPDLERGKVPEDWWYFPVVARLHNERTGYPTQKPEALLERIILASSNPGDIVADFFCGSGTTPNIASHLGRRFIASDITWRAVHTTRTRLVQQGAEPFSILSEAPSKFPIIESNLPIRLDGLKLQLSPEIRSALDYWETDPASDRQVFRSAMQAWRPRKQHLVADQMELPIQPYKSPIRLRLVSTTGEYWETNIYPA